LLWLVLPVLFLALRAGVSGCGRCCFEFELFGWFWEGGEEGTVSWWWRSDEGFEVCKVSFYTIQRGREGGMVGSVREK
jgi:hypothetical protein